MTTRDIWSRTSERRVPLDLALVVLYLAAVTAFLIGSPNGVASPLQVVLGAPLVLFLPGYALLTVLYPGRCRDSTLAVTRDEHSTVLDRDGLTWGERAAVSFAASLALVPLLAILFAVARVPLNPVPIILGLGAVTLLGTVVGALRRLQLPPSERLMLPTRRWGEELRRATVEAPSRRDAVLNTVLLVAILAALTGLVYGLAAPPAGVGYTEATLLTSQGGELVAGNYTTEYTADESASLVLMVENQEGGPRTYTVVVALERVRGSGENFRVVERDVLTRLTMDVAAGEIVRKRHTIRPSLRGENLRLSYYLFVGDGPTTLADSVPKHHLYLWIDVGQQNVGQASIEAERIEREGSEREHAGKNRGKSAALRSPRFRGAV